ncbi:hypothetical protein ACFQZU_16340, partial [Streptomonospora algeriensis]
MPSGKRLPPTRFPLPMRLAAAIPLGTLFAGSGLVGLPAPAAAVSDPAAPVLSFSPATATIAPGKVVDAVLSIDPGDAGGTVCLYDLTVDGTFTPDSGIRGTTPPAAVAISGQPKKSADVHAAITYTEVDEGAECPKEPEQVTTAATAAPLAVAVEESTPPPTESPTGSPEPSAEPTPSPTDSAEPSPEPSDTPTHSPEPTAEP